MNPVYSSARFMFGKWEKLFEMSYIFSYNICELVGAKTKLSEFSENSKRRRGGSCTGKKNRKAGRGLSIVKCGSSPHVRAPHVVECESQNEVFRFVHARDSCGTERESLARLASLVTPVSFLYCGQRLV